MSGKILSPSHDLEYRDEKTDEGNGVNQNRQTTGNRKSISVFTAAIIFTAVFFSILMVITAFPRKNPMDKKHVDRFVNDTLNLWKKTYGSEKGLKVARIDIHFGAEPREFVNDEGAVIVPSGIDLPKGQAIIATAVYPPPAREFTVDGIKTVAWAYPGYCRTEMNLTALCLVRQTVQQKKAIFPQDTTAKGLSRSFLSDALAKAEDIEEHSLEKCDGLKEWAEESAKKGSHVQRFKALVERIAKGIKEMPEAKARNEEDICAAIRKPGYSVHTAHVLSVMAAREIDIPCYGFIAATPRRNSIVGTYSDQTGWIYYDLSDPKKGFFTEPPVLLTLCPLISEFEASHDRFWDAGAGGYKKTGWGVNEFTFTAWGEANLKTDYTLARTILLDGWKESQ